MQSLVSTEISLEQAIVQGARSIPIFGKAFFPRTFRQTSPVFHFEMSDMILTPGNRMLAFEVFRDGAKTSLARVTAAFKVAYGLGNTGMIVGHNAAHPQRSIRWLKKQIEFNRNFTSAFKLSKGAKWADDWIEIRNDSIGPVHGAPSIYSFVALGITGSTRGLNIDDYRPDFILCDDICDNENTATAEQRAKVDEALFGDLARSLSPASESPLAQLLFIQTPIDAQDAISKAKDDPRFKHLAISCFDAAGQSSWPARRSTDELLAEKQGYIKRRQLHIWMREMEVKVIQSEKTLFDLAWFEDFSVVPDEIEYFITIDPAPVDLDVEAGQHEDRDWQVVTMMGYYKDTFWVECQHSAKSEDVDQTIDRIFAWSKKFNTRTIVVETVAYQKTLAWMIQKESERRHYYLIIEPFTDKRKKSDRITQSIQDTAPYGRLKVRSACIQFLTEAGGYGVGYKGHDDHLDGVSIGISFKKKSFDPNKDIEGEYKKLLNESEDSDSQSEGSFQTCP